MHKKPLHLGVTGGIGSGKSTVCRLLADRGASVIDADAISRALTAEGGAALPAIAQAFGEGVFQSPGILDREKLRRLVFDDGAARHTLQNLLHPMIAQEISRQAAAAAAQSVACIAFDIPLLVESVRWRPMLHRVLVVDCSPATQIKRVGARSGLDAASVQKIMASQSSRANRLQAADYVLCNESVRIDEISAQLGLMFPFLEI
jgi:dephospho-CoA kinase